MKTLFKFVIAAWLFIALFWVLNKMNAQTRDIVVEPSASNITVVGRGLIWGATGQSGVNNNYIITPKSDYSNACFFVINNNPSSSHSFTLNIWATGDPSTTIFQNNQGRWKDLLTTNTMTPTVALGQTYVFPVSFASGSHFAITISNSTVQAGAPDTADIFLIQGKSPCTQDNPGTFKSDLSSGNFPITTPAACDQSLAVIVNAGVTSQIVTASTNGSLIHVCGYNMSFIGAPAAAVSVTFEEGTGVNCATGTTPDSFNIAGSNEAPIIFGSGLGQVFSTQIPLDNLCVFNSTSVNVTVDVSYARY